MPGAREVLNRLRWDPRMKSGDYVVTFIHRGAEGDQKVIPYAAVERLHRSWFTYKTGSEGGLIPYHRVLEVKDSRRGMTLWARRRPAKRDDSPTPRGKVKNPSLTQ